MQTTTKRPARVAGELYFPTDISSDQLFEAIGRLRKEAQDEIDRLLAFLDETDGYSTTEREINGDEADASFPESGTTILVAPMEDDEETGDREDDPAECGIADLDGLMEQVGKSYGEAL
jgi:hypothetical protein